MLCKLLHILLQHIKINCKIYQIIDLLDKFIFMHNFTFVTYFCEKLHTSLTLCEKLHTHVKLLFYLQTHFLIFKQSR